MLDILKQPYRHPVVRDLAWVMSSPGLLQEAPDDQAIITDDWCLNVSSTYAKHLHELDENPEPLLTALSKRKSHRLGIYFEWLLRYWLEKVVQVEQLGHNVPVFQMQKSGGKRTLGEFDYLFKMDGNSPQQHWEATVKFYLQKFDEHGRPFWIGPGDQDRLDIKLDRLFRHQLKLAEFPDAKTLLSEMGSGGVRAAGFIKGYLFYPLGEGGTISPCFSVAGEEVTYTLSKHHQKGWWLHWREQPLPTTTAGSRWIVLPKPRWLSPVLLEPSEEAVLLEEGGLAAYFDSHFSLQNEPMLVAELGWQSDAWVEISRGFVLPPI